MSRVSGAPRRRSVPHLTAGALLVVACAAGAVVAASRLDGRQSVLSLARPVAAGQVLAIGDVRPVEVAADGELDLLPAGSASTVVGRPVAYSLPAGALLTRSSLGTAQVPAAGEATAAVGLRAGQFPPDLAAGTRVAVLVSAGTDQAASAAGTGAPGVGTSWTGVVVAVDAADGEQSTVVSLRMRESDARAVAAAPAGRLTLVVLGGGG